MFGMGMGEIVLIAIVALLVLGPDRLPGAAKAIGKGIRDLRMQTKDLQQTIEKDTQIGDAVRELRGALRGDPESLYERATGQRFSDGLTGAKTKNKQSGDAEIDKSALPDTSESEAARTDAEPSNDARGEPADPGALASASPSDSSADPEPAADPDSESFEPVIRSAPGAVARSGGDGDNSSHG